MCNEQYIAVSELNLYIKTYLENNYFLQDVYVKGEISNFKAHQSGTLYFAIKDEKSAINVVMFKTYASKLKVNLKDGDLVLIKGKISVYEARGTYSINATEIIFDSKGQLLIQFEQLKQQLLLEGLFAKEFKKTLPLYPNRIGLITAPYGAAVQDMLRTIKTRWPLANIYIFECLVQGTGAANDIVKKIDIADKYGLDVIICGRGGGSIEDLWPFNEEIVARAFFKCKTPIISAVGHEIDVTISDYIADARGLTPTDGAVKATPDIKNIYEKTLNLKNKVITYFINYLENNKKYVSTLSKSYVLLNPSKIYESYRFKIDDLENRLSSSIYKTTHQELFNIKVKKELIEKNIIKIINNNHKLLSNYSGRLDAMSPLKVLKRGYVFATKDNKIIKNIDDVEVNDILDLSISDGTIKTKVISKEK